jgi:mRNA-degrading endonuclease RelE of RelBE toxin-antitoxin system
LEIVKSNHFKRKFEKISDQEAIDEIMNRIGEFCASPTSPPEHLQDGILKNDKLAKKYGKIRKFRAHHKYRIIYSINTDEQKITFLTIAHRRQIYDKELKGL